MDQLLEVGSERVLRIWVHPNGEDMEMVEVLQGRREQNLADGESGSREMVG